MEGRSLCLITTRNISIALFLPFVLISSTYAGGKNAAANLKPKIGCSAMQGQKIPASKIALPTNGATIISATLDPGSGDSVPHANFVPPFCKIDGAIAPLDPSAPPINFRVDVPVNWNQKAIQLAGNGFDGFIPNLAALARSAPGSPLGPAFPPDAPYPIAQGYAMFGGDGGHSGASAPDPDEVPGPKTAGMGYLYATPGTGAAATAPAGRPFTGNPAWWGNEEALANFAHEAIKKTHDVAVEIVTQMYGTKPRFTYFMGESQGGREAAGAVAYYPEDYDGVLISVPIVYFTGLHTARYYRIRLQMAPGAWLPVSKTPVLAKEVLRQCDALDGLEDGVINNYYACNKLFGPATTPDAMSRIRCPGGADTGNDCLSDKQIATVISIHAPIKFGFPLANGETEYPGVSAGGEGASGWVALQVQPDPAKPGQYEGVADPLFQSRYNDRQKYSLLTHSFSELQEPIQSTSKLMDVSTDWSKFFAHGGKLIFHAAADDNQGNGRANMFLYEQEVKRFGQSKVDKSIRFYVTPNAGHGSIGYSITTDTPQARYMDLVSYLEDWVENGKTPPDAIPQTLKETTAPYKVIRSRPLCRYPKYPRYNGSGDPDKMESYTCSAP